MMSAARYLLLGGIFFAGCHAAEKVAVTSFHVIDAPAKYIRDRVDHTETTTTTTTTTADVSDVSTPGRPLASPTPKVTRHETRTSSSNTAATTRRSSSTSSTATSKQEFPTAKPVPGKPGYVYSIDPKGGIIDVTGYKPGDKAKDPYTQQIFIVP